MRSPPALCCEVSQHTGAEASQHSAAKPPALWCEVSKHPSAKLPLAERREHVEDLLIIRLVPCIVEHLAVADDAVFVEYEHGPFGDAFEADHVLVEDAVVANHLLVEVAQQGKRELLVGLEGLQSEERVDADAVYFRVAPIELGQVIAKCAELFRSDRAERGGKKRQHDRPAALGAERHRAPILIGQCEVRRSRSNVYRHEASSSAGYL